MASPAPLKFACPVCGQRISFALSDAETIGLCPGCRSEVQVPAPPGLLERLPALHLRECGPALAGLLLCASPLTLVPLLRGVNVATNPKAFGAIAGAALLACLAGVVLSHLALRRAQGWLLPKAVSILGLALGYLTSLLLALLLAVLSLGNSALLAPMPEVPDFVPDQNGS